MVVVIMTNNKNKQTSNIYTISLTLTVKQPLIWQLASLTNNLSL